MNDFDQHGIIHAAVELMHFLNHNVGNNNDWPIRITGDDEDATNELCRRMTKLDTCLTDAGFEVKKQTISVD